MFSNHLDAGKLLRTKTTVSLYTVPPHQGVPTERVYVDPDSFILALTPINIVPIGWTSTKRVYRYQFFALCSERIVSFTCVGISDRLIDNAFEIVNTDDPNA